MLSAYYTYGECYAKYYLKFNSQKRSLLQPQCFIRLIKFNGNCKYVFKPLPAKLKTNLALDLDSPYLFMYVAIYSDIRTVYCVRRTLRGACCLINHFSNEKPSSLPRWPHHCSPLPPLITPPHHQPVSTCITNSFSLLLTYLVTLNRVQI